MCLADSGKCSRARAGTGYKFGFSSVAVLRSLDIPYRPFDSEDGWDRDTLSSHKWIYSIIETAQSLFTHAQLPLARRGRLESVWCLLIIALVDSGRLDELNHMSV